MEITEAIVHKLVKVQGSKDVDIELKGALPTITPALQRLVTFVHDAYSKRSGKSYGAFEADAELHPTQTYLRRLINEGKGSFVDVSHSLMKVLADKAKKESFATGGYVLIVDMNNGATRWFLVAVLTDVAGAAINADLEVIDATHLDLSAMRFAGRVNITDWDAGAERYISFLRGKKSDVSEYFQDFIGCSTLIKPLQETQRLVQVVKKFAVDQGLDEATREKLLAEVHGFALACAKEKRELDLDALANHVWPDDPEVLQTVFGSADPAISDGFIPDGRALGGLTKFKAKTPTWSIEFDRSAMSDHTIRFDAKTRELKITQIPDDIAAKLSQEFSNDDDAP